MRWKRYQPQFATLRRAEHTVTDHKTIKDNTVGLTLTPATCFIRRDSAHYPA
jgi:hypothetical protein